MLKIDTQGYEKKVIDGATGLLPRITALQIELSVVELYEGAPSMTGMLQQLSETGFQLFNLTHGFKDPGSGRLLQLDGFFLRPAAAEPA